MSLPARHLDVFILSDATGLTAEMVISAVLVQFAEIAPRFHRFPYIKTREQITEIFTLAQVKEGIVIYSLVAKDLRNWAKKQKKLLQVYADDLLGPFLDQLGRHLRMMPQLKAGIQRDLREESVRLAEAIDFTLRHDDGQGIESIDKADLIILGVSRTSKTPTSLYVSCNYGLRVANVPIVLDMRPPDAVLHAKNKKAGLIISPDRLSFIRQRRMKYADDVEYGDIAFVRKEIAYCRRLFEGMRGLLMIDVTYSSIEETAQNIVESIGIRR